MGKAPFFLFERDHPTSPPKSTKIHQKIAIPRRTPRPKSQIPRTRWDHGKIRRFNSDRGFRQEMHADLHQTAHDLLPPQDTLDAPFNPLLQCSSQEKVSHAVDCLVPPIHLSASMLSHIEPCQGRSPWFAHHCNKKHASS